MALTEENARLLAEMRKAEERRLLKVRAQHLRWHIEELTEEISIREYHMRKKKRNLESVLKRIEILERDH